MLDNKSATIAAPQDQCKDNAFQRLTQENQEKKSIFQQLDEEAAAPSQLRAMPLDGLNGQVQNIINECSDAVNAHKDFFTGSALVAAGVAGGNRAMLTHGTWANTAMLWLAIVARSGAGKSEPLTMMLRPLEARDRYYYEGYLAEKNEWEAGGCKGPKPFCRQIIITDTTPEARNEAIGRNPDRLLLHRDELRGIIDDIGRYNKSGEVSDLLSIWRRETIRVNRRGGELLNVGTPYLSIVGTIQPSMLVDTFGKPLFIGNGFNYRWLFAYPEIGRLEYRPSRAIDPCVSRAWADIIGNILNATTQPRNFTLAPDAAERYELFKRDNVERANTLDNDYLIEMWSKFDVHALRLALAVHLLNVGCGYDSDVIGLDVMDYSVRLCSYFAECGKTVYNIIPGGLPQRHMGNEQLLAMLCSRYGVTSTDALGAALGISGQAVRKAIGKSEKKH